MDRGRPRELDRTGRAASYRAGPHRSKQNVARARRVGHAEDSHRGMRRLTAVSARCSCGGVHPYGVPALTFWQSPPGARQPADSASRPALRSGRLSPRACLSLGPRKAHAGAAVFGAVRELSDFHRVVSTGVLAVPRLRTGREVQRSAEPLVYGKLGFLQGSVAGVRELSDYVCRHAARLTPCQSTDGATTLTFAASR